MSVETLLRCFIHLNFLERRIIGIKAKNTTNPNILIDESWNDFSTHTKALNSKDFIHLEEKFIDGQLKQVISLSAKGLNQYNSLIENLIDFIESSSVYTTYTGKNGE